jgi:uncharacterized membrane protein YbhN (UPF0104 family)
MTEQERLKNISDKKEKEITQQFSYKRIAVVIVFSLAISALLIITSFDFDAFRMIQWNTESLFWIGCGFLLLVMRHLGYMYRLRLITDFKFSWRQSFNVISLWEFSSSVTPSTVGGAAVAIYFMKKEKLSLGKSAATSMLTIFLDQVFLAAVGILMFIIVGAQHMFASDANCRSQSELPLMGMFHNMQTIYFFGYFIFLIVIAALAYGLFINAKAFRGMLSSIFSIRFLKKWRGDAIQTGEDIMLASEVLKTKNTKFWIYSMFATSVAWVSFFLIPVCIINAFFDPTLVQVPEMFSRMFSIWMIMLLPISPGGAGIAELTFSAMMCDFTDPALVATLALIWRIITFYPYLFAGVFILPRWINKVYSN